MPFLTLLAEIVRYLLRAPYRLLSYVGRLRFFRMITEKAVGDTAREAKKVGKVGKFFRGVGRVLLFLLVVALVSGVFVGLWYLNYRLDLERQLAGPWAALRPFWLPLLLGLFVALCLAAWWLWKLLGPEREPDDYADIWEAWTEARAALEEAGVKLAETPLFLVLGRPAAGVDALFGASRLPFLVRQAPKRGDAPVQVYANAQGIYVACPGASLLARLSALLVERDSGMHDPPSTPAGTVFEEPEEDHTMAGDALPMMQQSAEPLLLLGEDEGRATATLAVTMPAVRQRPPTRLIKRTDDVALSAARLRYLGRLIAYHRRPYCPVNGVLLVLPFAAAGDDEEAGGAAALAQADLDALRDGFGTEAPVYTLVSDLESVPGFAAFARLFPDDRRLRLLGQSLPLVPDLPEVKLPAMAEDGVRWIGEALRRLMLKHLREDAPLRDNAAVCQFCGAVEERLPRLSRIVAKAALLDGGKRVRLGGCYLGATGGDPAKEQAFVAGVFRLLVENQNRVAWTAESLKEEEEYRFWTTLGYVGIGVFVAAVVAAAYWQLR